MERVLNIVRREEEILGILFAFNFLITVIDFINIGHTRADTNALMD